MILPHALWAAAILAGGVFAVPAPAVQAQAAPQFQPMPSSPQGDQRQFRREEPASPGTAMEAPAAGGDQTGSLGAGWTPEVQQEAYRGYTAGAPLDTHTIDLVQRINDYFNTMVNLEGRFLQIDPNNKQSRGRFYVQRPGLLRFDYAPPSLMRIVADGRYLSIEDHDLKTIDKYPLEATPFRMLLKADVDLLRDARIVSLVEGEQGLVVTLEDKGGDVSGRLMLIFAVGDGGELAMREWVITDPQGLDTRIVLDELVRGKQMDRDFFAAAKVGFPGSN